MSPPVIWSIAGTDSGGGAGLTADQRAADAFGVHLCPVVAAVTAQHSQAVTHVEPLRPELLDAQLSALADDLPPRVIKTGLLGSAANVARVAHWIDRLRERAPVALVVDPVLGASTGRSFADATTRQAYRELLLPRATLITPNQHEAAWLQGDHTTQPGHPALPALARSLRASGCAAVAITGGDSADLQGQVLDWIDTPHAAGWLAAARIPTPHHHGSGCTYASSAAAALALGFVPADALVLAKMATLQALHQGYAAGGGAGPVHAGPGFGLNPAWLPTLSWGESPRLAAGATSGHPQRHRPHHTRLDLYAVVDSADRVDQVLAAGIRTVQLRIKTPADPDRAWHHRLLTEIQRCIQACRAAGAQSYINDHWPLAAAHGAYGVHLGQEDLLALGDAGRDELLATGLQLGISSHSLWELARARTLAPRYIACGPVWPTLTKAMPWQAQGLDNLAWWCAMAGTPVVAIGGLLSAAQFEAAARCGADGVCAVRVLGDEPAQTTPALQRALQTGRYGPPSAVPALPHPALPPTHSPTLAG